MVLRFFSSATLIRIE